MIVVSSILDMKSVIAIDKYYMIVYIVTIYVIITLVL